MAETFPIDFGRYELQERLAIGGMAELFKARVHGAHGFEKAVVIKRILPHLGEDPEFVRMFIDEAKITARLEHPKIVQVLDLGTIDDELYIAMEFVDGFDLLSLLRSCVKRKRYIPVHLGLHIVHEVLDALDHAHNACDADGEPLGIVHRDISPANVLISNKGHVKLADFGIARALERQSKTQAGTLKGKYGYMSPEQVQALDLDSRSDVFSVGILLAETLMNRRLFNAANDLDVLLMVREARTDRLDKYGKRVKPKLRALIDKALEKERSARYQTAAEFREALADRLFAMKQRVRPADIARFLADASAAVDSRSTRIAAVEHARETGDDDDSTLSGERTRAERLRADAIAARAREILFGGNVTPVTAVPAEPAPEPAPLGPIPEPGPAAAIPEPILPEESDTIIIVEQTLQHDDRSASMTATAVAAPATDEGLMSGGDNSGERPDDLGDLATTPPLRVMYRIAVERSNGRLGVRLSGITKKIYFQDGRPQFVSSNVPSERFGEYLVRERVLSRGELSMALAMMPQFDNKLADTLVGLGLMSPLEAVRHLSDQVRSKVVDVCTWHKGMFEWHKGAYEPPWPTRLELDPFEILGAAANRLDARNVATWAHEVGNATVARVGRPRIEPEQFRAGNTPRVVFDMLTGKLTLNQLVQRYATEEHRIALMRTVYLLIQTELAHLG